jgi:hypothetical protein
MSVGVMEDYKLKDLRASHTLDPRAVMPHRTTARAVNPPHNRTCGTCGKRAGIFFFYQIYNENRNVFPKKRGVLMKNVYYLSALVLKIQYTQKFEDKYKQNESLSSLSRLG